MRVFVTGATGFIGSAVVRELIAHGHRVLGMSRSDEGAAALKAAGAEVHRGDLADVKSLQAGAAQADAVAHLAFNHDFSKYVENGQEDRRAILAMGEVLAGRPMLVTSGATFTGTGATATEADGPIPGMPRASEAGAQELADRGLNVSAVRLPPTVHGLGDKGFVPMLVSLAREKGVSAYVGEGRNRWPAVHRLDAAKVYRLALEHGAVTDGPFHAIAEEGIAFRTIAETIGQGLGVPVKSIDAGEAPEHFGWMAMFGGFDAPMSAARTKALLGWSPTEPGLLADMEAGYF